MTEHRPFEWTDGTGAVVGRPRARSLVLGVAGPVLGLLACDSNPDPECPAIYYTSSSTLEIVDGATSSEICGAAVGITRVDGRPSDCAMSLATFTGSTRVEQCNYSFKCSEAGKYEVSVSKDGYRSARQVTTLEVTSCGDVFGVFGMDLRFELEPT